MLTYLIMAGLLFWIVVGIFTHGRAFGRHIYKIFAGGMPVILEDYQGKMYKTLARRTPSGKLAAPVFFFTNTGSAILEDDGTVKDSYIEFWVKG